jgi:hypothetical protein
VKLARSNELGTAHERLEQLRDELRRRVGRSI